MERPRVLHDGSLAWPHRGVPPIPLPGYEAAPDDPYLHLISFEPCFHRCQRTEKRGCCPRTEMICAAKDKIVNRIVCKGCDRMPAIATQGKNFLKALARFAVSGAIIDREERDKICQECVYRKDNRCTACGCNLAAKQSMSTEKCPIGAW